MDDSSSEVDPETFERSFKEYQICLEQVSRLEANIWQTATLLGIGSIVALVSLINNDAQSQAPFGVILAVSIFTITVSLVWLRFAKRWWSIQSIKFERMSEIDTSIGFRQNILVDERNREALSHQLYLKENSNFIKSLWTRLFFSIPKEVRAKEGHQKAQTYEHRGNRPVVELLVAENILIWVSFLIYSAWERNRLPVTIITLSGLLIVVFHYWRRP